MGKFRKKPVEVEAWPVAQILRSFTHDWPPLPPSIAAAYERGELVAIADDEFTIRTLEGDMLAQRDDWLIRGVKGEFYPCKREIFEATYEGVASDGR